MLLDVSVLFLVSALKLCMQNPSTLVPLTVNIFLHVVHFSKLFWCCPLAAQQYNVKK